jgi:hypothetical protein
VTEDGWIFPSGWPLGVFIPDSRPATSRGSGSITSSRRGVMLSSDPRHTYTETLWLAVWRPLARA